MFVLLFSDSALGLLFCLTALNFLACLLVELMRHLSPHKVSENNCNSNLPLASHFCHNVLKCEDELYFLRIFTVDDILHLQTSVQ